MVKDKKYQQYERAANRYLRMAVQNRDRYPTDREFILASLEGFKNLRKKYGVVVNAKKVH